MHRPQIRGASLSSTGLVQISKRANITGTEEVLTLYLLTVTGLVC